MSEIEKNVEQQPENSGRRKMLKASALALATAGVYGAAPFFGPWKHNHVWSQTAQKKPLVLGLTMDASGQYAASGMDERLGAMMAIKEINAKGGVLGRPIEAIHMDTETTPATGSRVAERLITRNEAAFLDRRAPFGRGQRDLAGRAEVRLHLSSTPTPVRRRKRARIAIA